MTWRHLGHLQLQSRVVLLDIHIAYTEQGENHGTMILDGVCYSAIIQLCKIQPLVDDL